MPTSRVGLNQPLQQACLQGDTETFRKCLASGADLNRRERWTPPLLAIASAGGNVEIVKSLLEHSSIDVEATDDVGNTALHVATERKHPSVVKVLLKHGAHVDAVNDRARTPLMQACQAGNTKSIELLLTHKANVWVKDADGKTALDYALCRKIDDNVRLLAKKMVQISATDSFLSLLGRLLHRLYDLRHADTMESLLAAHPCIVDHVVHGKTLLHRACKDEYLAAIHGVLNHGASVDKVDERNESALHVLCDQKKTRLDIVRLLLKNKANINLVNQDGNTPIHLGIDKMELLVVLLAHGALVDVPNKRGQTGLSLAAAKGRIDVVKLLIQYGAKIDCPDANQETPLFHSCRENHHGVAWYLLSQAGADMHTVNRQGWTPLHVACYNQNLRIVKMLLQFGASIDKESTSVINPLHLACQVNTRANVLNRLFQNCAKVYFSQENYIASLHAAYKANNAELVSFLLDEGVSPNVLDEHNMTPLHYACQAATVDVARLLLESGASVSSVTKEGSTPLHLACQTLKVSTPELVKLLLRYGASANATDELGMTPLHHACLSSSPHVVELLILRGGADTEAATTEGWRPLHLACRRRHNVTTTVRMLLDRGVRVDVTTTTAQRETPLHVTCQRGSWDVLEVLLEHGANVNATTSNGQVALHQVVRSGQPEIVRLLLWYGARLDMADNHGWTPLLMARKDVQMLFFLMQECNAPLPYIQVT